MIFKALASSGSGRFSLMERSLPPGGRMPPPHRHIDCDEAYFVLNGDVSFILEGETNVGSARTWVLVPGGVGHTFGNRSTQRRDSSFFTARHSTATSPTFMSCGTEHRRRAPRRSSTSCIATAWIPLPGIRTARATVPDSECQAQLAAWLSRADQALAITSRFGLPHQQRRAKGQCHPLREGKEPPLHVEHACASAAVRNVAGAGHPCGNPHHDRLTRTK